MIIDLQTIDEDGKNYTFNETSEELEGLFGDLIGDRPFQVDLQLTTLGNTYMITGQVKSSYEDVCSQCGYDIDLPLKSKINEILVIEKERPRNTQVSQSPQNLDMDSPSVTYLNSPSFDLGEFLHEMMASGFDLYPKCIDTELCASRQYQSVHTATQDRPGHPGFAALKGLKVSKH